MGSGAGKQRYVAPEGPSSIEAKTVVVGPKSDAPVMTPFSKPSLPAEPMLLVADVGGTNSRLHVFKVPEEACVVVPESCSVFKAKYSNRNWDSFLEVVKDFLGKANLPCPPYVGCLAVAGVVVDNRCNLVNLGWKLDGDLMAQELGMASIHLINDFEAQGYGILTLDTETECDCLQEAQKVPGAPIALIGAGTGLGQAFMTTGENGDYEVWPSEGGHKEFAPRQEGSSHLQNEMIKYLQIKFSAKSRISVERIVSGRGIANIYQFLAWKFPEQINKEVHNEFLGPMEGTHQKMPNDPAVIVEAARSGTCQLSLQALNLFVGAYGAEAGVMALKTMPLGGLYVTGGVSVKTRDFILGQKGSPKHFIEAFLDKGRVSAMLTRVPVFLVKGEDMGERGVNLKAMRLFAEHMMARQISKGRQQWTRSFS
eukprot:TRINITY_DN77351_c0_g1_i1.p1 TRINITY_DN77351_c0_g1~~TRINITY_DN77351_c0_g1_i1.p1  ORF type:complete len:425 (+),score=82.73 TRINITY_DN77351_c0_g1_i1:31-1305(+)